MKRLSVGLVLAAVSGCQLWLEVDPPQCLSDRACESLLGEGYTCSNAGVCVAPKREEDSGMPDAGPPLPPRWACLRDDKKSINVDPERKLKLRLDVVDIETKLVPQGLVGKACSPGDIECRNPFGAEVTPGDDGFLEFEVPHGFEGFIQLNAPEFVPGLSYDSRPYTANVETSGPAIVKPAALSLIAQFSGSANKPDTGLVFLEVRDCMDAAADGVSYEPIEDLQPFYFDGILPSRTLSATTVSNQLAADREPRAVGGFADLSEGYKTFKAVLPDTGDVVSSITVQIRANQITYVRMRAGY